jgi:hypothetical protein
MEISLYNQNGAPVAYIADDNETIYLWNGQPVAYLYGEKVYGYSGRHLGWFINGIIYDGVGEKIGFTSEKCPSMKGSAPLKAHKHMKQLKGTKEMAQMRPMLRASCSSADFKAFLEQGA